MNARRMVNKLANDIRTVITPCNSFAFYVVSKNLKDGSKVCNGKRACHRDNAMHYMKRPACTFLHGLGRNDDRGHPFQSHLFQRVILNKQLLDRMDFPTEVEVSAQTIDHYYKLVTKRGEKDDVFNKWVGERAPGQDGAEASQIWGDRVFTITISEVQQLLRSTLVSTSEHLPLLFLQDFARRFCVDETHSWFFAQARAVPLNNICDDIKWAEELTTIIKGQAGNIKAADDRLKTFDLDMQSAKDEVMEDGGKGNHANKRQAELVFSKSLVELSTEICVSQKGYFLTDGRTEEDCEEHNQLCSKSNCPIVFLSAP
eukprot:gene58168-biopygen79003